MHNAPVLTTVCAAHVAVAPADFARLHWKWRDADNGWSPLVVVLLWPLVLPMLAVYYIVVRCYPFGAVLRGRRAGQHHRNTATIAASTACYLESGDIARRSSNLVAWC